MLKNNIQNLEIKEFTDRISYLEYMNDHYTTRCRNEESKVRWMTRRWSRAIDIIFWFYFNSLI